MTAPPATVMPEIVEEILLRVSPDDPAALVRAAVAGKPWRRLISDARFRRRYREIHRTEPLLGFVRNFTDGDGDEFARFVPTSSLRPPRADRRGLRAVDSRHGRVLLCTAPWLEDPSRNALFVWDPATDRERKLPALPRYPFPNPWNWHAAVLAPDAACESGRLDPFLVVFVGTTDNGRFACVYSSKAREWSKPTSVEHFGRNHFQLAPAALAGNALYFMFHESTQILKYDLATRGISMINLPNAFSDQRIVLTTAEDGGLGFATVEEDSRIYLWSRETDPKAVVGWAPSRAVDLGMLLPADALRTSPEVVAVADGNAAILLGTDEGLFAIDLKSGNARKVEDVNGGYYDAFPYACFCMPCIALLHS